MRNYGGVSTFGTPAFIKRMEYDSNGDIVYIGLAVPGTDESSVGWQIREFECDSEGNLISENFASGNANFDKTWSLRDIYSYS